MTSPGAPQSMPAGRVSGKVALVTGAASGIGRAIALRLAAEGAAVYATDVNLDGLAETASSAAAGAELSYGLCDVADCHAIEASVEEAVRRYGRLTTMCNNAGVLYAGSVLETTEAEFSRTLAVNLGGTFYGCKYAVLAMRDGGGQGSIINTASVNGLVAEKGLVAYCATKGAILMLTKAVALDHAGDGIRCNCICPGFVDTPINLPHFERFGGVSAVRAALTEAIPLGRGGSADEVAAVALFLASDESSYLTGTALTVDGGITAGL